MATAEFSPPDVSVQSAGVALQGRLLALARRRNAQKMGEALVRWAIPGMGIAAASVLLYKLHIIADGPVWAPPAIIGAFLLLGFRSGLAQRVGSFSAACDADQILNLEDRLSSALSFVEPAQLQRKVKIAPAQGRLAKLKAALFPQFAFSHAVSVPPTNLVPALVGEAAGRAQNLDPKKVYPLRFDRPALALTGLALLFAVFCVMPDYPVFQTVAQRQQVAAMQKAGEKLVAVAKTIQKDPTPKAEEVKALSRRLEKLGQKMVRGRMTKRAALTQIGELRQQLEKAQKQPRSSSGQNEGSPQIAEALRQAPLQSEAGRKIQDKLAQNKWEEAAKELDDLADKVEKGTLSDQEKEKTAQDLEKTARDLRSRGGQANQDAAKQLESAANQLRQKQSQGQAEQKQQGQQGQQGGQQNQSQSGQQGQKQPGQSGQQGQQQQQQGGQKQNQSGQQNQNGQQQQGGQQQQNQSGQKQGSQGHQQQQGGQQQQSQSGQQSQQGGQQQQQQSPGGQGQQGQSNQQGSQGGQGQTGQSGEGSSDQQGTAEALRNMANGLRQGGTSGGGSQDMRNMMEKLREAENETGSNGGQQSGLGKPGQGDGESGTGSQGNMQHVTPGKDIMPSDPHGQVGGGAGLGPRNNAQGVQHGGGVSKMKSVSTGDKRRYADAWSNRLPKTHGRIDRITGKWGSSGDMEQMATKGDAKGGQVKTPYYQAYESYKNDPEEATSRDNVPPAYKDSVKNYFESIKP